MEYFKPEDFAYTYTDEEKSDAANAKLQKLIEALVFIEPIVKVECKHKPKWTASHEFRLLQNECEYCGVKLKAEWKEVK